VLENDAPLTVTTLTCADKQTKPPKPFTDASLMQAMVNIAAYVSKPEIKKVLTDADGLGTPATRPGIIETLFHRNYIERRGKTIVSTALGRQLIGALPEVATTPDMTAVWETAMRAITEDKESLTAFLERVSSQIHFLVRQAKAEGKVSVPPGTEPAHVRSTSRRRDKPVPKDRPSAR
jgi:DNA topoisomerase-3